MGSIVDKTRTRYGKLRPYLIFTPIPLGIVTVLFFGGPVFLGEVSIAAKIVYMSVTYFVWEFFYTIGDIPFWGLSAAISPNPADRSRAITSARFISSVVGGLPGIVVPVCIDLCRNGMGLAMADVFLGKEPFTVLPLGEPAERIIDGIHALLSNSEADISQTEYGVMRQLLELFMLIDKHRKQGQGQMSLFEKICEYIDHNIFSDISLSSICEKFFISSSTLYRVFKTNTGLSPKEYVQSKKIEVAKRMIAANDSSLNSIAAALNFYDSHHFFHAFRTATGMSPSEYKKEVLQEIEQ
jgi:AraC-like DNA-binding protein